MGGGVGSLGCRAVGTGLWGILVDVHLVGVYNSLVSFNGGSISWGWRRGSFRAVPAPGRVCFPTVGASGWGGEAAPKYGLEVSSTGA